MNVGHLAASPDKRPPRQDEAGQDEAGQDEDPVRILFGRWGLRLGRATGGWTVGSVKRANEDTTALVEFIRGTQKIDVTFKRATTEARLARVGGIDISHGAVDGSLARDAAGLVKLLAAWLTQHGAGALLLPLLALRREAEPEAEPIIPSYLLVDEAPPLNPARKAPDGRPVLDFEFIEISELDRIPDAVREIYNGTRGGIVIRSVYSKEDVAKVVKRLETGGEKFPKMVLPPNMKSHFLGLCLERGDATLTEYLDAAERFREETLSAFSDTAPFEERMEEMFRRVSGGRNVQLARFTDGRPYTPATVRVLPQGSQLATHCGNEMMSRRSYRHLNSIIDPHDQISYFLTLQAPDAGGGLIIYSLKFAEIRPENLLKDGRSNVASLLGESEWMEVRPNAGDLLLFDGGRYFHRVDWITSPATRWTIGGFMMFDRKGETLLYWA